MLNAVATNPPSNIIFNLPRMLQVLLAILTLFLEYKPLTASMFDYHLRR